ncbi:MAG: FtsX-like permease family protein, partial [Oscillospiraceae bacterium]|nr:FtsX-like permease family protein [Oscillospiraceae bacterium]
MKKGFYPHLAFDGIRKNKRLYLPYILTQIGMIMMYYIVIFLRYGKSLEGTFGDKTVNVVLMFGGWVIAIFACIFLFYTNSFLIRRRKKEFGLYNILGMDKKNISILLFWESLITSAISLFCGLVLGEGQLDDMSVIHEVFLLAGHGRVMEVLAEQQPQYAQGGDA